VEKILWGANMAKGFLNLNRFKHGRAIKQNSRQKAKWQDRKREAKFRGQDR